MSHFLKAFTFERESNVYPLFSKTKGNRRNGHIHFYLPWDVRCDDELMFKIKLEIKNEGKSCIPFGAINSSEKLRVSEQIGFGVETHLVMSNLNSIHILRVREIIDAGDKSSLIVDDLFVFRGGHCERASLVEDDLQALVEQPLAENVFYQWEGVSHASSFENTEKWVLQNRSLTYEYFFKGIELQNNVYGESWNVLFKGSRHEIIKADLKKHNAGNCNSLDKFYLLRESFEHYFRSVVFELNDIYIFPLINEIRKEEILFNEWNKVSETPSYKAVKNIMEDLIQCQEMMVFSLENIVEYLHCAKSFIFTLKNSFSKLIFSDEYLFIESFLERSTVLVDSFSIKGLDKKVNNLIEIKSWLDRNAPFIETCSHSELSECNLKFKNILDMFMSFDEENNLVLRICREKAARNFLTPKNMNKESKSLLRKDFAQSRAISKNKKVG